MPELLYQLALTLVPNIGDVQARILLQHCGEASGVFKARTAVLEKIEGIGMVRARSIKKFSDFHLAEKEIRFIEQYNINPLFITDKDYPRRLLNCYDAPALLFHMGDTDLNTSRVLAIVGTRSHSEYGKDFTEKLISDLAAHNVLIVSGLAFGIDAISHKAALKNNLPTVGVVGHGLDKIYPYEHKYLAKDMVKQGGGILTEFFSGTQPDRHHFPLRNRIVAGLSDATVVIETNVKGGSMITAKLADSYNRDVFAVPGRATDRQSSGCNFLIRCNKATLLTGAAELLDLMGWNERDRQRTSQQRALFIELTEPEKQVMQLLQQKECMHIDEINGQSNLSTTTAAAAILNLELKNLVKTLPGKMYKLL